MIASNTVNNFAPSLIYSDPFDDATTFKFDQAITLHFNETVAAGSGNIIISNGTDTRTIDVNDSNQVDLDLGKVTIHPLTDLAANTTYHIQMASGVIVDTADNPYSGIDDTTTLNFTTSANSEPLLNQSNPFNGATDFQADANITLTFDENVSAGDGNIIISNGADTHIIDIDDSSQVTFEESTVTINPATDLTADTYYNVQIASGVITDTAGNAFPGLNEANALMYRTTIASDPNLTSSIPSIGENEFQIDRNIELYFDENVVAGSGNILISNGTDTRAIAIDDTSQVTFSGSKVIINPTDDLLGDTAYHIQIPTGAITDEAGNAFAGTNNITFATISTDPILTFSNIKNNTAFKIDNDITLFFDRTVTAGNGNIILSNGTDTHTIAIDDTSQVSFNMGNVIINPAMDLAANEIYHIEIASGVIMDTAGHNFAGIDNIAFTTVNSDPVLDSSNINNNPAFAIDDGITLIFDEMVTAGSGNIILSNGADTHTIAIEDSDQVTFTHDEVRINPTEELIANTTYNVQIGNGVIVDTAGNPFAGIDNATFTTTNSDPLLEFSFPEKKSTLKVDDNITLFFNETVTARSGDIIISNGSDTRTIAINDSSQITFNPPSTSAGSTFNPSHGLVTINPHIDLAADTTYNVQIASGVITDSAGHSFGGLSDFTFTTIASNPELTFSLPTNDGSLKIDQDISLYFDETVTAGTGNIILSNGSDTRTIAIDDASQIIFNANSLIINPTDNLLADTTYNVQIDSGVIEDTAGNAFAGISDASFTTIHSGPILTSSNPKNKSTIKTDGDILLNFDEKVIAGNGDIVISSGSDTRTIAIDDTSQVTFSKFGVTINPTDDLIPNTNYSVQIPNGAITDKAGHAYAGFDDASITSTNADPLLVFSNPLNNAIFQSHKNIELFFDETVIAGNGNIIISNGTDNRTIAIDDTSQVTFHGHIVTINPTTDLVADTTYHFQMESGVITDSAGNAFAGINEATLAITDNPLLTGSHPSNGSTFEIADDLLLYFDETIVAGDGNIIISNGIDTREIAINDTSQVRFETTPDLAHIGTTPTLSTAIIINPVEDLIPDTTYHILIENNAIEDTDGNLYAGIEDSASLNFTTFDGITSGAPLLPIVI